ncbi:bifunctional DNA primase/polymerase [Sporosarcina sp. P17b]|uniref:bifunctional DNA primase/polymerase n=1 Tax=Sporosarcina sp. P17b TaxID=2048260 RepID=UPI000C164806|nr:bifunctional DNA primase/polymerase [Sporosarcina sp. P17b]PIC75034.1 DNA primase [Sporosarcina sp. P17b]
MIGRLFLDVIAKNVLTSESAIWDRVHLLRKGLKLMSTIITKPIHEININMRNAKMLKSSLAYAKLFNWHVFPVHSLNAGKCTCSNPDCKQIAKHPIPHNGLKSATNDPETIKQWWTVDYPGANIGVRTGLESGIFVLDVDIHKVDGRETLKELEEQHDQLPETIQSITGSGGNHYLFNYQSGIGNKVNFRPGLDIRGDGGYVVVAPSVHESGSCYEWELSSRPLDVPIADAPEWLTNLLKKPIRLSDGDTIAQPSSHWQKLMQGLSEGEGRNPAATSIVGHLLSKRVDLLLVYEMLHLWNERNDPPMNREELDGVITSIARKEIERRGK